MEGYAKGQEAQTITILENLAAYLSLLRQHIRKEDYIFFPMVEREIPREEHQWLLEAFSQEGMKMGVGYLVKSKRGLYEMAGLLLI